MFEQNIAELEKKNPSLAEKIRNHAEVKGIEVFQSESKNFIIAYNGVLLHSNEDPLRESKSIWHKTVKNDLSTNDIQVVYGLGLGYLFKRAYVSANTRILLFEPSLDVLRFVFENVALSAELADDRVFFVNTMDEALQFFCDKYLPGDKIEVMFLPGYLNLPDSHLLEFSNEICKIVKDRSIDQNTIFLNAKASVGNFISRLDAFSDFKPVNALKDVAKGKTALVVAAGPSLQNDIELIKQNRSKFIVIAILPIVSLLLDNDIEPDFVTVVDSSNQMFKIEDYKDKFANISFVMESRADRALDEIKTKSKFIYFPFVDSLSTVILEALPDESVKQLPAVASVAILSFELAKLMGCSKIVFSGLDLALTGNKPYAHDYIQIASEAGETLVLECSKGLYSAKLTTVKSANGSDVKTREDYLLFVREFSKFAGQSPDIELINTAIDGALIQGMTYAPMSEVVEDIKEDVDFDFAGILKSLKKVSLSKFKKKAQKIFEVTKSELEELKPNLERGLLALKGLINELKAKEPDYEKFQKLFNENIPVFSQTRTFLTQNFLLSTYLQAEIAEFIASYNKDSQPSLEKIKANLEVELNLQNATSAAVDALLPLITKK